MYACILGWVAVSDCLYINVLYVYTYVHMHRYTLDLFINKVNSLLCYFD